MLPQTTQRFGSIQEFLAQEPRMAVIAQHLARRWATEHMLSALSYMAIPHW